MAADPAPATGHRRARVVRSQVPLRERIGRIIRSRELLTGMIRKELKVKYKNSVLGFAWSLLNPLLYLVVFYVAFDLILGSGVPAFPIWLLSGLLVWNLFSTGLASATGSVVGNAALVKKVAFSREVLPLAAIGSALVHFFLQGLVLLAVLVVVRWNVAWSYLVLLPLALVALLVLAAGLGILLSAVNVRLRDTQHFLELALLAWFWMTPVVYQFELVGGRRTGSGGVPWSSYAFMANPVTPVVIVFQRALYGRTINTEAAAGSGQLLPSWGVGGYLAYLGLTLGVGLIAALVGLRVFGRSEADFAEEL